MYATGGIGPNQEKIAQLFAEEQLDEMEVFACASVLERAALMCLNQQDLDKVSAKFMNGRYACLHPIMEEQPRPG